MKLLRLICLALVVSWPVHAGLVWEQKEIQCKAEPNDKSATATFKFTNKGARTITVFSVNPSCGCVAAVLQKKLYAPGEAGEIAITFKFGDRAGLQTESAMVRTDDEKSDTELKIAVTIPKLFTLTPQLLFWHVGDELRAKEAVFKIEVEDPAEQLTLASPDPRIKASAEPIKPGKEYKITVTPDPGITGPLVSSAITIETTLASGQKVSALLHAFAKH